MPPYVSVLGAEIITPVGLVYEITTAWRSSSASCKSQASELCCWPQLDYQRCWTEPVRGRQSQASVSAFVVVAVDLSAKSDQPAKQGPRTGDLSGISLGTLPASVAEYPLQPAEVPEYDSMLFQELHGKPVINGYAAGTVEEQRALSVADLRAPQAADRSRP
jgi:hypothetical protein